MYLKLLLSCFIALAVITMGCVTPDSENIDVVANKMQEVYSSINTIQAVEKTTQTIHPPTYDEGEGPSGERESSGQEIGWPPHWRIKNAMLPQTITITTQIYFEKEDKEKRVFDYSLSSDYFIEMPLSRLILGEKAYFDMRDGIKAGCYSGNLVPNFRELLLGLIKKFPDMKLVGIEEISGRLAYKIELDAHHYVWIDKETYFPLKLLQGSMETIYSDFKINEPLPTNIFDIPAKLNIKQYRIRGVIRYYSKHL